MICFFGLVVDASGASLRLFQGVARLHHDGFVAPVLALDAIISVARLALVACSLRTRGCPPAGVDERSLFINRMFRGGVGFAR